MNFDELTKIILLFNNVDRLIIDRKDIEYMTIGNVTENFYLTSFINSLEQRTQQTKLEKNSEKFILIFYHYGNQDIIEKIVNKNLGSIMLVDQSSPNTKNRIHLPWNSSLDDEENDLMDYEIENDYIKITVSEKGALNS